MKGYKRTHGVAYCRECDFSEENYLKAAIEARKHYKKTGHKVDVEIGLSTTYGVHL